MISHPDPETFVLDNGLVSRTLTVNGNGLHTSKFINLKSGVDYVYATGMELSFQFNKERFTNYSETATRELDGVTEVNQCGFIFTGFEIKNHEVKNLRCTLSVHRWWLSMLFTAFIPALPE